MIQLSSSTDTFIPIAPYLFDIFDSVELNKNGKPSTIKKFDFKANVKANNAYLGTRIYQVKKRNFENLNCF